MRCSICSHTSRVAIEEAAEATSVEAAADKFGISERALAKHLTEHPRAKAKAPKPAPQARRLDRSRAASPAKAKPAADEAPPPTSRSPESTSNASARAKVEALLRQIESLKAEAESDDRRFADRLAACRALVAPIKLLGQLTGELGASEATVATSPHYRRIRTAIVEALRPFPDAARAVAAALEQVERGAEPSEAAA